MAALPKVSVSSSRTPCCEPELISLAQLRMLFGNRSRQWVYDQLRSNPAFPKSVTLGVRSVAWRLSEVREFINALPRHELSGLSGPQRQVVAAASKAGAT